MGLEFVDHSVGVGEIYVSNNKNSVISAIGLGSCIGVVALDPEVGVGGIAHVQLPYSSEVGGSGSRRAFANADKGIPELLKQLENFGASLEKLFVLLAGGAQVGKGNDFFKIGEKNQKACLEIFARYGLDIREMRLGGHSWRSVRLHLLTGQISIRSKGGVLELINASGMPHIDPDCRKGQLVLKSAQDIEDYLLHITRESGSSKKIKPEKKLNNLGDIKRVLTHLTQEEIKHVRKERKKIKVKNLQELEDVLAKITDSIPKNVPQPASKTPSFSPKKRRSLKFNSVDEITRGLAHLTGADKTKKKRSSRSSG